MVSWVGGQQTLDNGWGCMTDRLTGTHVNPIRNACWIAVDDAHNSFGFKLPALGVYLFVYWSTTISAVKYSAPF